MELVKIYTVKNLQLGTTCEAQDIVYNAETGAGKVTETFSRAMTLQEVSAEKDSLQGVSHTLKNLQIDEAKIAAVDALVSSLESVENQAQN